MKRRIASLLLIMAMLLSLMPLEAFAAENYELYINEFQFASNSLTYRGDSGTATYDPNSKTLTLKDLSFCTNSYNTAIYSLIDDLKICVDGKTSITLRERFSDQADDPALTEVNMALALNKDTEVYGAHNDRTKDKIVIASKSVSTTSTYGEGTTRIGLATANLAKLTMRNITLSMTDNSASAYLGRADLLRANGNTEIENCKLEANQCHLGLYMSAASATVKNTEFNMSLTGSSNSGLNFDVDTDNRLENCSGTIRSQYPLYSYGKVTITGSDKLSLQDAEMAVVAKNYDSTRGGKVIFDNANVEIGAAKIGIQIENKGSAAVKTGGTVAVTAEKDGVMLHGDGKLSLAGGTLSVTGTKPESTIGLYLNGEMEVLGGELKTDGVYIAVQNLGGKTLSVTGGKHLLKAAIAGYADNASSALHIGGTADVTIEAPTGIQLSTSQKGRFELSGGKLTLHCTTNGLYLLSGAGKTTLSGGKLYITDKNATPTATGIYASGELEICGTEAVFSHCKYDVQSRNAANRLTAGKLELSGASAGMQIGYGFTMSGGEISSQSTNFGLVILQGGVTLQAGRVNLNGGYPFYLASGGTIDFAGATVSAKTTANCALYVDTDTTSGVNSYKISGGSVKLQSTQAAANAVYTAIPSNYGVWVGADESSAKLADKVTQPILATNKYAYFAEKQVYTLTLVNVKEGESAQYYGDASFTYTAKDAPENRHFSHWELTVDEKTTKVGTETTYSGKMPFADATLKAVYEDCRGGTATCTQKAKCEVCGKPYGNLAAHSYTAEVADETYLKSAADCENAAVYYKSCTGCGASSKGTEHEATFTHGNALGHEEVVDAAREATCTESGLTEGKHCQRCKKVLAAQNELPPLGHDIPNGTVTKEPTCTQEGEKTGTCVRCSKENVTQILPKTAHNKEITLPAVAATCEQSGWTEGKQCSACGTITEGHEMLWPLAHTIVTEPETSEWTIGKYCSVCGKILVQKARKGGNLWTDDGNYDAELYASEPGDWVISDAADLAALAKKVNDGSTFSGCTVTLAADIDLSAHNWNSIGGRIYTTYKTILHCFEGTFRGQMHRITGLRQYVTCHGDGNENSGLFGYLNFATVTDLVIEGNICYFNYDGNRGMHGGLSGGVYGSTIRNCAFIGSIYHERVDYSVEQNVGGLIGYMGGNSTVENCFVIANIESKSSNSRLGGLIGSAANWTDEEAIVENCFAAVNLSVDEGPWNSSRMNGMCADAYYITFRNCYTQIGFDVKGNSKNARGEIMTKEAMQAASGADLSAGQVPLIDLLNSWVQTHLEAGREMLCRPWVMDAAANHAYPTFGSAVIAKWDGGTVGKPMQIVALGDTVDPAAFALPTNRRVVWYTDAEFTTVFDFSQKIYENTVLYGKEESYPIHYVLDGGENAASNPTEYICGVGVTAFADPTRENYIFEGWFTDAAFINPITTISAETVGEVTLYAKWRLDPNHPHQFGSCILGADGLHDHICSICQTAFDCEYTAVTTEPTCTSAGFTTHTCTVCGLSYVDSIVEGGHIWVKATHAPTHTEMGYTTYTCSRCQEHYDTDFVAPLGHSFDEGTVTREASCTEDGEMTYTCVCGATYQASIPKKAHELETAVTAPTCTEMGYTTHSCRHCDYTYTDSYAAPTGHTWNEGTVTREASCTEDGEMTYTCACSATRTEVIAKTGHDFEQTMTAPTCTEMGYTTHACKRCDFRYDDTFIAPNGHKLTAAVTAPTCTEMGYTTHTCDNCDFFMVDTYVVALGHHWEEGKVMSAPTLTETGLLVQTCTACGATQESTIPMLTACDGGNGCPSLAYTDIPGHTHWSHVGIDFVLKSGLFYGTSETNFSPDSTMTRAMLVTVLYRLEGQPKTENDNPFTDVEEGKWYTNAVKWAAENKIVSGVGNNRFAPSAEITREQLATILHRYALSKGLVKDGAEFTEDFADLAQIAPYAADGMKWANASGLLLGMNREGVRCLDPKGNATRAQVAAIFMRFVQNVLK